MNYVFFIARRLFSHRSDAKKVSRPAILIATAGIAVGLAVMIISICVVLGFKEEIRSKVVGFGGHIQVMNYKSLYAYDSSPIVFSDDLVQQLKKSDTNVAHIQHVCTKSGMLKTDQHFKGVQFKGIGRDYDTRFLKEHMVAGEIPDFCDTEASNKILLSEMTARELNLKLGDKVFAYFFEETVRARRFTIAGIYSTNLTEFDNQLIFTDLYTCQKLNNWEPDQYSGLEIQTADYSKLAETTLHLAKCTNGISDRYEESYVTMSIEELYPQFFVWLQLLDTNIVVILVLMMGVAGFTMISGLLIIILERTNFIGVMKALGATDASIRRIFLWFSFFLIVRGVLIGNLIGVGLMFLQQSTGLIRLDPVTYYVDQVPIIINWWYILWVNLATVIAAVSVLVLPSFLISRISPVKSIRFE